jgi:hypothetical protein
MQSHENMQGILYLAHIDRVYVQKRITITLTLSTNNVYSTVDLLPNHWS